MPPARLLLVEDTVSLAALYREFLRDEGHEIRHVGTLSDARRALAEEPPEAVLLDLRLPDGDGLDLLRELRAMSRPPPVVVMTAHGSVGTAVEAMRAGASDFLVKPFAAERLTVTLANLLERAALRREVETLAAGAPRTGFAGFIGAAPAGRAPDPARRIRPLAEVEREAIEEAIRLCGGNIPKAAAFLGVSPSTLYRKREAWERRG